MDNLILILLLVSPVVIYLAVSRNRDLQRRLRAATVDLRVDEFGVTRELADGREETIDWSDVTGIEVMRTKRGPHAGAGGVVVLWGDETRGCLVPIDRAQDSGLLEALCRFPDLDMSVLVEALAAEPESQVVVWEREETGPVGGDG